MVLQESYTLDSPLYSVEERLPESFFLEEDAVTKDTTRSPPPPPPPPPLPAREADFSEFETASSSSSSSSSPGAAGAATAFAPILGYRERDRIDRPSEPLIYDILVGADMSGSEEGGEDYDQDYYYPYQDDDLSLPDFKLAVGSVGEPEPAYQQVPGEHVGLQGAHDARTLLHRYLKFSCTLVATGIYRQLQQQAGVPPPSGDATASPETPAMDPNGVAYTVQSPPYGHQVRGRRAPSFATKKLHYCTLLANPSSSQAT